MGCSTACSEHFACAIQLTSRMLFGYDPLLRATALDGPHLGVEPDVAIGVPKEWVEGLARFGPEHVAAIRKALTALSGSVGPLPRRVDHGPLPSTGLTMRTSCPIRLATSLSSRHDLLPDC